MAGDHSDASSHVKLYMGIFGALAVLTVVTVAIGNVNLGHTNNVIVALLIAATKASLVAFIFMHLKWEKSSSLWLVFGICAIFFVVLLVLPVLTTNDHPPQVHIGTWSHVDAAPAAPGH